MATFKIESSTRGFGGSAPLWSFDVETENDATKVDAIRVDADLPPRNDSVRRPALISVRLKSRTGLHLHCRFNDDPVDFYVPGFEGASLTLLLTPAAANGTNILPATFRLAAGQRIPIPAQYIPATGLAAYLDFRPVDWINWPPSPRGLGTRPTRIYLTDQGIEWCAPLPIPFAPESGRAPGTAWSFVRLAFDGIHLPTLGPQNCLAPYGADSENKGEIDRRLVVTAYPDHPESVMPPQAIGVLLASLRTRWRTICAPLSGTRLSEFIAAEFTQSPRFQLRWIAKVDRAKSSLSIHAAFVDLDLRDVRLWLRDPKDSNERAALRPRAAQLGMIHDNLGQDQHIQKLGLLLVSPNPPSAGRNPWRATITGPATGSVAAATMSLSSGQSAGRVRAVLPEGEPIFLHSDQGWLETVLPKPDKPKDGNRSLRTAAPPSTGGVMEGSVFFDRRETPWQALPGRVCLSAAEGFFASYELTVPWGQDAVVANSERLFVRFDGVDARIEGFLWRAAGRADRSMVVPDLSTGPMALTPIALSTRPADAGEVSALDKCFQLAPFRIEKLGFFDQTRTSDPPKAYLNLGETAGNQAIAWQRPPFAAIAQMSMTRVGQWSGRPEFTRDLAPFVLKNGVVEISRNVEGQLVIGGQAATSTTLHPDWPFPIPGAKQGKATIGFAMIGISGLCAMPDPNPGTLASAWRGWAKQLVGYNWGVSVLGEFFASATVPPKAAPPDAEVPGAPIAVNATDAANSKTRADHWRQQANRHALIAVENEIAIPYRMPQGCFAIETLAPPRIWSGVQYEFSPPVSNAYGDFVVGGQSLAGEKGLRGISLNQGVLGTEVRNSSPSFATIGGRMFDAEGIGTWRATDALATSYRSILNTAIEIPLLSVRSVKIAALGHVWFFDAVDVPLEEDNGGWKLHGSAPCRKADIDEKAWLPYDFDTARPPSSAGSLLLGGAVWSLGDAAAKDTLDLGGLRFRPLRLAAIDTGPDKSLLGFAVAGSLTLPSMRDSGAHGNPVVLKFAKQGGDFALVALTAAKIEENVDVSTANAAPIVWRIGCDIGGGERVPVTIDGTISLAGDRSALNLVGKVSIPILGGMATTAGANLSSANRWKLGPLALAFGNPGDDKPKVELRQIDLAIPDAPKVGISVAIPIFIESSRPTKAFVARLTIDDQAQGSCVLRDAADVADIVRSDTPWSAEFRADGLSMAFVAQPGAAFSILGLDFDRGSKVSVGLAASIGGREDDRTIAGFTCKIAVKARDGSDGNRRLLACFSAEPKGSGLTWNSELRLWAKYNELTSKIDWPDAKFSGNSERDVTIDTAGGIPVHQVTLEVSNARVEYQNGASTPTVFAAATHRLTMPNNDTFTWLSRDPISLSPDTPSLPDAQIGYDPTVDKNPVPRAYRGFDGADFRIVWSNMKFPSIRGRSLCLLPRKDGGVRLVSLPYLLPVPGSNPPTWRFSQSAVPTGNRKYTLGPTDVAAPAFESRVEATAATAADSNFVAAFAVEQFEFDPPTQPQTPTAATPFWLRSLVSLAKWRAELPAPGALDALTLSVGDDRQAAVESRLLRVGSQVEKESRISLCVLRGSDKANSLVELDPDEEGFASIRRALEASEAKELPKAEIVELLRARVPGGLVAVALLPDQLDARALWLEYPPVRITAGIPLRARDAALYDSPDRLGPLGAPAGGCDYLEPTRTRLEVDHGAAALDQDRATVGWRDRLISVPTAQIPILQEHIRVPQFVTASREGMRRAPPVPRLSTNPARARVDMPDPPAGGWKRVSGATSSRLIVGERAGMTLVYRDRTLSGRARGGFAIPGPSHPRAIRTPRNFPLPRAGLVDRVQRRTQGGMSSSERCHVVPAIADTLYDPKGEWIAYFQVATPANAVLTPDDFNGEFVINSTFDTRLPPPPQAPWPGSGVMRATLQAFGKRFDLGQSPNSDLNNGKACFVLERERLNELRLDLARDPTAANAVLSIATLNAAGDGLYPAFKFPTLRFPLFAGYGKAVPSAQLSANTILFTDPSYDRDLSTATATKKMAIAANLSIELHADRRIYRPDQTLHLLILAEGSNAPLTAKLSGKFLSDSGVTLDLQFADPVDGKLRDSIDLALSLHYAVPIALLVPRGGGGPIGQTGSLMLTYAAAGKSETLMLTIDPLAIDPTPAGAYAALGRAGTGPALVVAFATSPMPERVDFVDFEADAPSGFVRRRAIFRWRIVDFAGSSTYDIAKFDRYGAGQIPF